MQPDMYHYALSIIQQACQPWLGGLFHDCGASRCGRLHAKEAQQKERFRHKFELIEAKAISKLRSRLGQQVRKLSISKGSASQCYSAAAIAVAAGSWHCHDNRHHHHDHLRNIINCLLVSAAGQRRRRICRPTLRHNAMCRAIQRLLQAKARVRVHTKSQ